MADAMHSSVNYILPREVFGLVNGKMMRSSHFIEDMVIETLLMPWLLGLFIPVEFVIHIVKLMLHIASYHNIA